MASAMYSESPASRLSISLESSSTASPFPSPSSSFLPPPTPGAHEFAVKPAPSGRASRKASTPSLLSSNSSNASPSASPRSSSMITPKSDCAPVPESSSQSSHANGQATAPTLDVKGCAGQAQAQAQIMSSRMSGNPSPAIEVASVSATSAQGASPSPYSTALSPVTPTPSNERSLTSTVPTALMSPNLPVQVPSSSTSATPTNHTMCLPPEYADQTPLDSASRQPSSDSLSPKNLPAIDVSTSGRRSLDVPGEIPRPRTNTITQGSRPLSTASTASTASYASAGSSASAFDPSLFSSRPAPPSPGGSSPSLSRKISMTSKAGSKPVSRANSLRKGAAGPNSSPGPTLAGRGEGAAGSHHSHRASVGSQLNQSFSLPSPLASPRKTEFEMGISASSPAVQETPLPSFAAVPSEHSSGSPSTTSTSTSSVSTSDVQLQLLQDEHKVLVKIRDFAFQQQDERHTGLGPLVPKSNRVGRMNRRLGRTDSTVSASSISSSDGDGAEEDDADGWGWGMGGYGGGRELNGYGGSWGGFKMGMGRFGWTVNSSAAAAAATAATIFDQEKAYAAAAANLTASTNNSNNNYPSRSDMDRNFLDSESEEYYDAEDDEGLYDDEDEGVFQEAKEGQDEDEEPLYPGLYRAMYPFEPEGTAEMRLVEDQIVRVVARGGGVGWAVVVAPDEEVDGLNSSTEGIYRAPKHALVPESYLEPYKLDWEIEEAAAANVSAKNAV